jgi:hypothetical protein
MWKNLQESAISALTFILISGGPLLLLSLTKSWQVAGIAAGVAAALGHSNRENLNLSTFFKLLIFYGAVSLFFRLGGNQ